MPFFALISELKNRPRIQTVAYAKRRERRYKKLEERLAKKFPHVAIVAHRGLSPVINVSAETAMAVSEGLDCSFDTVKGEIRIF